MIFTEMLLEAEPKPSLQAMASVNPYKSTKNQNTLLNRSTWQNNDSF